MSEIDAIIRTCETNHRILSKNSEEDLKEMMVNGKHLMQLNTLIYKLALEVKELKFNK
jgi:hypothetical protein